MPSTQVPTIPRPNPPVPTTSWIRRYPNACILAALILTMAFAPFYEQIPGGDRLETAILSLMLLSSLLAVRARRTEFIWAIVLLVPALLGKWLNDAFPDVVPPQTFLAPGLLFLLFLVIHMLRYIIRSARVDSEVLCAGIAGYLILGLLWSFAYIIVARFVPDAFNITTGPPTARQMKGFTAIYFSFITLCTVGYGEIVPVAGAARMLAVMEAMCGTFYVTIIIARLVAMYSVHPPETPHPDNSKQLPPP